MKEFLRLLLAMWVQASVSIYPAPVLFFGYRSVYWRRYSPANNLEPDDGEDDPDDGDDDGGGNGNDDGPPPDPSPLPVGNGADIDEEFRELTDKEKIGV